MMELVRLAATVLFCAKDFNAAFRIRDWILRSANPEPDLENMFCATPFGDTTSGGKAVMETMFAGTSGEMVTMYFLEGDDLALVHYCSAGNQPKMKLETPRDSNVLSFRCLGGTNMTEQDSHMHWPASI